uniref:Sushi, von Willebrand factor type A, EGF and pentraxin domain-containing protein 1-like n=1 Tax=Phallusia mammillata TaxID=59560 RepID=A0A6F9DV22_9ASCI|nr:sushi, von Willebrand factor type A, EGF and pentraxin domain-containing protein 1-like [Phallusia mammillata]
MERWTSGPTCVAIECGDPPTIADGTFPAAPPYTPTETVSYTCSSTHTLNGPNSITCGSDGTWSAGPVCILTVCCPPPSIPLGTFSPIQDSYSPMDTVTYDCCNGITITGASTTNTCRNDGTWSVTGASLPSCTPTVCPPPPSVINGGVEPGSQKLTYTITPAETVTYECNAGVKPGAGDTNTCGADGLWTTVFPDVCNP